MTPQLHSPPSATTTSTLPIKLAIILTYMLFGALLNSVGAVNLLVVQTLGVPRADAALLDAWKDLPIAITSFLVASLLPRLGLKKSMLLAVAAVGAACLAMPVLSAFWAIKLLFCTLGAGFALVKVSAYSMIGLVTHDKAGHARFTNLLEGLFMVGVLGGFLLFSHAANAPGNGWLDVYPWLAGVAAAAFMLLLASPLDEGPIQSPGTTVRLTSSSTLLVPNDLWTCSMDTIGAAAAPGAPSTLGTGPLPASPDPTPAPALMPGRPP